MAADGLSVPTLSDSSEEKADWLELYALKDDDGNASFSDLVAALGFSGTADAIDDEETAGLSEALTDDARYEGGAEDAFSEIDDRVRSCEGSQHGYPFDVTANAILRQEATTDGVYSFLLLLSRFGNGAGGRDGAKLFEEVCAKAAESYLGADATHVSSYVFGFPRRIGPRGFATAVDNLCRELGEGCGHKDRPNSADQKDAKLDVVAWRDFADGRSGKLIVFGQCATGADWRGKTTELGLTADWCTLWMQDRPSTWPIRMFFVPHRVNERLWFETCVKGGILFDRCRIVQHSNLVPENLRARLAAWSAAALKKNLK